MELTNNNYKCNKYEILFNINNIDDIRRRNKIMRKLGNKVSNITELGKGQASMIRADMDKKFIIETVLTRDELSIIYRLHDCFVEPMISIPL